MDGPGQMKSWIGRRHLTRTNELIFFERTFITKAHGANIAATQTFNAAVKLHSPVPQARIKIHGIDPGDLFTLSLFSLGTLYETIGKWFFTFAGLGKLIRTTESNRNDFFFI